MTKAVSSFGIGSKKNENTYHIFAIGFNSVKVFFTEDGTWTEDICFCAESDDFEFVYNELSSILKDKQILEDLESSLLF
jgi:hypothetical protein